MSLLSFTTRHPHHHVDRLDRAAWAGLWSCNGRVRKLGWGWPNLDLKCVMCCGAEAKDFSFQLTVVKRVGWSNCFCSLSPFNKNIETLRSVIIGMPFHYNEKDMEKQEKEKGSGDTNNVLLGSISHQNSRIYTPNCWLVVHQLQLASLRQTRQWDTEIRTPPIC